MGTGRGQMAHRVYIQMASKSMLNDDSRNANKNYIKLPFSPIG